jgi:hypothetical protein
MENEIYPAAHIEEAIARLEHSVTYAPECEVRDEQTDLIREVLAECLKPALAELERREKAADLPIYGPCENCGGRTDEDGECHTCRDWGGTDKRIETAASLRTLGPLMGVLRKQSKSAALLDEAALALVDDEPVLATAEEISEALSMEER